MGENHEQTELARNIQAVLGEYSHAVDFPASRWEGIEALHFDLARLVDVAAIEAAPGFKYHSSKRDDADGRAWRLLIPDPDAAVTAVNCHSMWHDAVWTLATTIYSTKDVDVTKLGLIGSANFWDRVYAWTIAVAEALAADGVENQEVIEDLKARHQASSVLYELDKQLRPVVTKAFLRIEGRMPEWPEVHWGFSQCIVPDGSIGLTLLPTEEYNLDHAIVAVHPKSRDKPDYVREIVRHELLHIAIGEDPVPHHGYKFKAMAKAAGLPEKYTD